MWHRELGKGYKFVGIRRSQVPFKKINLIFSRIGYFDLKTKGVMEEFVEDDWCCGEEVGRLGKHRGQELRFYQTKPSWEQRVV